VRWVENPYFRCFSGEEFVRHHPAFDRSSTTRHQRMCEERLNGLVQETPTDAAITKALRPAEPAEVIANTTVQEKAVTFPTDARFADRARSRLVKLETGGPDPQCPTRSSDYRGDL